MISLIRTSNAMHISRHKKLNNSVLFKIHIPCIHISNGPVQHVNVSYNTSSAILDDFQLSPSACLRLFHQNGLLPSVGVVPPLMRVVEARADGRLDRHDAETSSD